MTDRRYAQFERFEIAMTLEQAQSVSGPGPADAAVEALVKEPTIRAELAKIDPSALAVELAEYGAWNDAELADTKANHRRIIWIAGSNIAEEE